MGEGGFEPPKPKQQIYSLPHLTALELSHTDLLITNQLLYQLSYTSKPLLSCFVLTTHL